MTDDSVTRRRCYTEGAGTAANGEQLSDDAGDMVDTGPEAAGHDRFLIDGPAAQRFWDKSALGVPQSGNRLLLSAAEVLFCNRQRNLALPEGWESVRLEQEGISGLLHEAAALEAVRTPGELVVLTQNLAKLNLPEAASESSWALRWPRIGRVTDGPPDGELRWVKASEAIDWRELHEWARATTAADRIAEVLIVDDDLDVTTYRLSSCNPTGEVNHTESDAGDENPFSVLLEDVIARGLLPRSGFKYGTRWRLYDRPLGEAHAPYLLQHEDEAPSDWAQICLSARMATGVNKTWLCGFEQGGNWRYLAVTRPPPDARWSGVRR